MKKTSVTVAVMSMVVSGVGLADVLRCGTGIVEAGASTVELLDRCGEPDSKSIEGMNWTYRIGGHSYQVRVSASGTVAKIREIGE